MNENRHPITNKRVSAGQNVVLILDLQSELRTATLVVNGVTQPGVVRNLPAWVLLSFTLSSHASLTFTSLERLQCIPPSFHHRTITLPRSVALSTHQTAESILTNSIRTDDEDAEGLTATSAFSGLDETNR